MIPFSYLGLAFGLSLAAFACVVAVPGARSPESLTGLPVWLLMVWGPTLAALILSYRNGDLTAFVARALDTSTVPILVWGLCLAPVALLFIMRPFAPDDVAPLGFGMIAVMIAFNLILGPLGEELGWRGYLQHHFQTQLGWLEASLMVGAIWLIWHLPLWLIDSPHSQISLPLFSVHVILYSVIIGGAYAISGGSVLPAILLHLTVNLASNWALFAGFKDPNAWFSASIPGYVAIAVVTIWIVYARTGEVGIRWVQG